MLYEMGPTYTAGNFEQGVDFLWTEGRIDGKGN